MGRRSSRKAVGARRDHGQSTSREGGESDMADEPPCWKSRQPHPAPSRAPPAFAHLEPREPPAQRVNALWRSDEAAVRKSRFRQGYS